MRFYIRVLALPLLAYTIIKRKALYSQLYSLILCEVYRMLGARVGKDVIIRPGVMMKGIKNIEIGDNCYIGENTSIVSYGASISIGSDVLIAENVYISTRNHKFRKRDVPISKQGYRCASVIISSNVWIAHGAVVLAGSCVPSGTVIAANCVADKSANKPYIHAGSCTLLEIKDP